VIKWVNLVVMVVSGENMQMKEPTVNQMEVEVKAGTMNPAMEHKQASAATMGSAIRNNLIIGT
jgi:hypothetical protein